MELWPKLRFRFTEETDVATYGGDWWVWDEKELAGLRGRDLIVLEEAVDMAWPVILDGFHTEKTLPTMAVMWIALHRAGHRACPRWDDFNPVVHLAEWEVIRDAPLGGAPDSGEAPTPDTDSSEAPTPSAGSATS